MDALVADRGVPGRHPAGRIEHGYAPGVIARVQQELDADLVAIGKHGQSVLEDLLLGSVALRTLATAPCDVLVVPARGRAT